MPKQPAPSRPGEPPQPQPPAPDMAPIKEPPERSDLAPIDPPQGDPAQRRVSVQPSARQERPARRPDRYDMIGAAIVVFIIALWVVHFLLPAPPPDVP
jgi:hypothetical protein